MATTRVTVILLLGLLVAAEVRADPAVRYWELGIPDLRWEFDDGFDDHALTVALPLLVAPWVFPFGARGERIPGGMPGRTTSISRPTLVLVPELVVEPQYQVSDGYLRAVLGARLFAVHGKSGAHVFVEGLGVIGEDGDGGGVGVGAGWGTVVSLAYRRVWAGDAVPNALMFDVRLAVWPPSQPGKTLDQLGRYRGPLPASPPR